MDVVPAFGAAPKIPLLNPLSSNPTKWLNTLKHLNCLSMFDQFVGLSLKVLKVSVLSYRL